MVVKMMGLRWAHLAVKEWQHGSTVGKHPNVVDYEDVMLHADDDKSLERLLIQGYESGKLASRKKRTTFPDRFICLTQEFMNRGTVQDWMDEGCLSLSGMLTVMHNVATALAYMHKNKVTHNDIKPENVMLHQEDNGEMIVKLGDLGCTTKNKETSADFWQYGMTVFCMTTGEKFGARKYRPEDAQTFCNEVTSACRKSGAEGRLGKALMGIPKLLQRVFAEEIPMSDVASSDILQGWSFFDSDDGSTKMRTAILNDLDEAAKRKACLNLGDDDV
jgi:serine/threonine protein kinase